MAGQHRYIGRRWFAAYALLAVLVIIGIFAHNAIARQLNNWKLLPQPERLTELSFANASTLPTTFAPEQTQAISFTTRNLEHRTTAYTYVITAKGETGGAQTLARGSFTLPNGQAQTTKTSVVLPALGNRELITVSLTNVSTSIDFWLKAEAKP